LGTQSGIAVCFSSAPCGLLDTLEDGLELFAMHSVACYNQVVLSYARIDTKVLQCFTSNAAV